MIDSVFELLGEQGPFVSRIDSFSVRLPQQQMAEAINEAIDDGHDLIVEAGTGTGKTFAYLLPALLSGKKVIISTGTKNLQDQLFYKDLPVVRNALSMPVSCALLKGRNNYLCHHFLEKTINFAPQQQPELTPKLVQIRDWAKQSQTGDIADFHLLSESDPVWHKLTSTSESCLGSDCEYHKDCFVMAARRQAQSADLVVINHHLLLSDLSLQEEGFGDLLPAADVYIIDEAHQLPEIASQFFGVGVSTQQFIDLSQDTQRAYLEDINESNDIDVLLKELANAAQDVKIAFGRELRRASWSEVENNNSVVKTLEKLKLKNRQLADYLKPLAERSKELQKSFERCESLSQRLVLVTETTTTEFIHWYEVHRRSVTIHVTPIDISTAFSEQKRNKSGVWVFTSATLTVANDFSHFQQRTGLTDAITQQWESPFDYSQQALLYIPQGMPEPNTNIYTERVIELTREVLTASEGRAFVLFTSYRALNLAEERLRDTLDFPLLVQGEAPRDRLLEKFRQTPHAVLLGTSSFWEGVDVRGEALSCVIIDKLPFAAPNDPVLQARLDALRKQGLNPFMEYQLPTAVIMLKQGAGRLIRDPKDRGVLVICDPRTRTKSYGKLFLNSLPPMPVTTDMTDVRTFFTHKAKTKEAAR